MSNTFTPYRPDMTRKLAAMDLLMRFQAAAVRSAPLDKDDMREIVQGLFELTQNNDNRAPERGFSVGYWVGEKP